MNDRLQVKFLRSYHGKAVSKVKPHLMAKEAVGSCAGAVILPDTVSAHLGDKVKILLHEYKNTLHVAICEFSLFATLKKLITSFYNGCPLCVRYQSSYISDAG